jgi:hypothetical protein
MTARAASTGIKALHLFRIVIGGGLALALSGISILCCYVFGTHLAPGQEGQIYGVLGGVADALKAVLPIGIAAAFAARQRARAITGMLLFAVFSAYSFASELGLYALSRDSQSSAAMAGKEGYELLKGERKRIGDRLKALGETRPVGAIKAEIAAQRQNKLWTASGQCKDSDTNAARTFCASLEKLAGELASAEEAERLRADDSKLAAKMSGMDLKSVMQSADAQSEALARFTGFAPSSIKDALAVLVALLIELGSGFGLWVVTVGGQAPARESPHARGASETEKAKRGRAKRRDPIKTFTRAVMIERTNGEVPAAEVHGAFIEWAKREGYNGLSATALGRKLSDMGFARVKRGGKLFYTGVTLAAGSRAN